jgi:hypothetical protein
MYLLYIFPPELHTLMTSLTHPRKIILFVLQIGKNRKQEKPQTYRTPTYKDLTRL